MPVPGSPRSTKVMGGSRPADRYGPDLHAWLYDVRPDGTSHPTWTDRVAKIVPSAATLHVSVEAVSDTTISRHLQIPAAVGMATEPVSVSPDGDSGHWKIRNRDRTNTLRVQPYELRAVPLRPNATMAMPGPDVAVWIPIVPPRGSPGYPAEAFRLLILHGLEPRRAPGPTLNITETQIRALTPEMREAIIMFFGEYLSWPPLPTPACPEGKQGQGDRRKVWSAGRKGPEVGHATAMTS